MAISGGDGSIILDTKVDTKGLNSGLNSMKGAITKIGGLLATAFSVKMLINFAKESRELYKVQMENEVKLATIMRQRMSATDEQIKQVLELTSTEQALGVVGDEVQIAGLQQLSTFATTTETIKTLLPAMNALIVQQNGFEASTGSAVNVANLMGKVLQGQTGALTRVGISFSEAEEQVLKFGTEEQRAAMLAQVITNNVGQMNYALAQTDVGRQQQLANTWGDIKEQFGAAFQQIAIIALPALNAVARALAWVANIARTVAQAIANIFGKKLTGWQDIQAQGAGVASSMEDATDAVSGLGGATKAAGKEAKKAGQEAKKTLAAFDDLTIVSENSSAGGAGGGGGAGGDGGTVGGFGDVSVEDSQLFETEQYDELLEKLQGALVLIGLIGTSLLAWKISDLLLTDSAKFLGQLQIISGWIMIVAGGILLLQGYSDAWANGIDWGNLATTIGGLALLISGIAIAISPMAAAFVAVGGGIALVVLGIKDIVENGASVQNILTIISGILISTFGVLAAMGKISVFGSLLPILATLAGAFITLYGVTDAWINGLDWTNFTAILGGLAIAITAIALSSDAMYAGIALVAGGIIALVVGMNDFIQNGASMQNTILIIGGAIAIAVGLATAGLSVLVAAIIGAVTAIGAFVAAIILEEPAIMSVTEAQENYTQAKENAVQAENNYISAVDGAEASMRKLEDAERKTGISGAELFKQVQSGSLDYKDLTDAQKEVYKAYIDNETKQKDLEKATKELTDAKKAETIASFENDLALAKESGSYDEYKASVIAAFEEGTLSAEEARTLIGKSMSEMSSDAQKAFMEDIPNDIKNGLDPNQYETTRKKIGDFFVDLWGDIQDVFSGVGDWFKTKFDEAWTNIKNVFASWGEFFGGLWDTVKQKFTDFGTKMGDAIGDAVKSGINSVLDLVERTINKAINLINGAIDLINLLPGVSVGKVGHITIPPLAKGAVLPPNKPFLALVGDQKHGTNIEAPLQTIVDAFNIALQGNANYGGGNTEVVLEIDGREFGRAVVEQGNRENRRIGTRLVIA